MEDAVKADALLGEVGTAGASWALAVDLVGENHDEDLIGGPKGVDGGGGEGTTDAWVFRAHVWGGSEGTGSEYFRELFRIVGVYKRIVLLVVEMM